MTRPLRETATRARLASKLLVLLLVGVFVLGAAGFISAVLSAGEGAGPGAAEGTPGATATPLASAASEAPALSTPSPTLASSMTPIAPAAGTSTGEPSEVVSEAVTATLPVVPVARYWTSVAGLTRGEVRRALGDGRSDGFDRVIVDDRIREALAVALGIAIDERVDGGDPERVERAVARGALGFLAATDVRPRVRALEVDGRSLFGNQRIGRTEAWPLLVEIPSDERWSQRDTWVLVAGGDSFTDRGVYETVVNKGRGVDYPFGGGTAHVSGHHCCDPVYDDNLVPTYRLTGGRGVVRRLFNDAELAVVNHESPITDGWSHHRSGFTFTGKPELTRIFTSAGIDWVSLANNHIADAGSEGIEDTRRILRRYGIRFGGAGRDLKQARQVDVLEVGDVRLAFVPCVGVAPNAYAGPATRGGTPCQGPVAKDIRSAGREADIVIAFPHWGAEYTRRPSAVQRKQAAAWVKAGADLVLGAHSHVAGAIEDIDGVPVLYSMGNLIFDQWWSTDTMESMIVEATFHGPELVQVRLHPYLTHLQAQPNLLDPARGEGRRLLGEVRTASRDLLDW
jgi:poly-gamma-glutamate synthesis protein (capsule biosynthesis protein)